MDTNKMREQFEAAYAALSTARNGRFHPQVFTRGGDEEYVIPSVQSAWWAWQASREAVVVELPEKDGPFTTNGVEYYSLHAEGRNQAIDEISSALVAQGLKVAP